MSDHLSTGILCMWLRREEVQSGIRFAPGYIKVQDYISGSFIQGHAAKLQPLAYSTSLVRRKLIMAPSRKSASVNKRFTYVNEVTSNKHGENGTKSKQKKRKFSDMLGPQWHKEELERFYEAYRKHGKDWKKVAAVVRNRTFEMVEALYTMNRAYLSLPEGTASVVGLVAMMTDHYCVLVEGMDPVELYGQIAVLQGGSESEQESNEGSGALQKPQKRTRGKLQNSISKRSGGPVDNVVESQSLASAYGCLSLLKKRRSGIKPHAVGKRTPRVPVSYSYEKERENFFLPARLGSKLKGHANNDDDYAHEIALALTEASQRDGSQLSQTPNRKSEVLSPVQNGERMRSESEMTSFKLRCGEMDEGGCELSLGSTGADDADYDRGKKNYAGAVEVPKKGKRFSVKKQEAEECKNNNLDDLKEACSGTEEGQKLDAFERRLEVYDMDVEMARSSSKGLRKRSKKALFVGDGESAFDALQTLADLSLMMPETTVDTESSGMVKEEHFNTKDKSKMKGNHSITGPETAASKTNKLGKNFDHTVDTFTVTKAGLDQSSTGTRKRKLKPSPSKLWMSKDDACADSLRNESQKNEAKDQVKKSINKGKRSSHPAGPAKARKWVKNSEHPSLDTGHVKEENEAPIPSENLISLITKIRRRRKSDLPKPHIQKELIVSENIAVGQPKEPIISSHDKTLFLKEKLLNCLSWNQLRRLCTFEWFYSAIDYPWFAKCEFVEYLNHVGLGHVPRLTRVEWGVIRSSLGRPRRFSEHFLKEEKQKLDQYRESVRKHYAELRSGTREGLPNDLAKPLYVGQRVVAIHPSTREVHDGSILTVDYSRCRVQFDLPELGVEFVSDINCMPVNPFENMPASVTRDSFSLDKIFGIGNLNDYKITVQQKEGKIDDHMKSFQNEKLKSADGPVHNSPSAHNISKILNPAKEEIPFSSSPSKSGLSERTNSQLTTNPQFSVFAQIQAKEADIQALSELTRALDKKEAVVSELRQMNDEVLENQKNGDSLLKDSEHFKKQYAAVLLQLNEVNEQVSSALFCLRQRNTYQGAPAMLLKPLSDLSDPNLLTQEPAGSHVGDIVGISRINAQTMVDAAMKAVSTLRKRGDNFESIEDAIDFVNNRLSENDSALPSEKSTTADTSQANLAAHNPMNLKNTLAISDVEDPKRFGSIVHNDVEIPSELIAHCVATLLMIQKCTERQFPPADVALVLDSAATSLQPRCSENLPIYAEIQKCMGIIRSQILALIPT